MSSIRGWSRLRTIDRVFTVSKQSWGLTMLEGEVIFFDLESWEELFNGSGWVRLRMIGECQYGTVEP